MSARSKVPDAATPDPLNEVRLRGRVTAVPQERTLPSGDVLVSFRIAVSRGDGRADALDCTAWTAGNRRRVSTWRIGDVVEVDGAIRRRFWRTPTGPASRHEVEVRTARRVLRAA